MAQARAGDGTELYFEAAGEPGGPAVLLVMGLGLPGAVWAETRDRLASAGHRVLTMDNRGIGRSQFLGEPYTTATMASDAVAVLDAAGVERAHVVGTSLGGMVAQRLALDHPRRVGALVLQSTTAGMPRIDFVPPYMPIGFAAMTRARKRGHPPDQRARAALRLATTSAYARDADLSDARLRVYLDAMASGGPSPGYRAQIRAASRHRAWKELEDIRAPTLIQHGAKDRMARAAAAHALAKRIPRARVEIYAGAGHFLALQRPDSIDAVARFVAAND